MSRYAVVNKRAQSQKKRNIIKKIAVSVCLVLVAAVAVAVWIYWKSMTPTILDVAQTKLKSETTKAVNEALNVIFSENGDYSDFVTIERDQNNDVVMIYANSALVNSLARNAAALSQSKINALNRFDVDIPIGTLSGIPLLSEKGPCVNIEVTPVGTVNCNFTSVFESVGINQTLHRIYINVESVVDLIIPSAHTQVTTLIPILICESMIIGKVPQTYFGGGLVLGSS